MDSNELPPDLPLACRWERIRRLQGLVDRLDHLIQSRSIGDTSGLLEPNGDKPKFDAGVVREYRTLLRYIAEEVGDRETDPAECDDPTEAFRGEV